MKRSLKFKRAIDTIYVPNKEILKDLHRKSKQKITYFSTPQSPQPSTSSAKPELYEPQPSSSAHLETEADDPDDPSA
ncbi:hypothetical protein Hamer_G016369 [Homarus americanus]|uniref:Uncharacterized protein n=1 Tax=Homarus americanus TaxID=6706 RepID=A0A8J5THH6_HOMAM|nr:hypothetical protein Hamer_G016369 [Homarus americanus]